MGVDMIRLPSEAVFSLMINVEEFYGSPISARSNGLYMDVDRAISSNVALDGDQDKAKQFMVVSGITGSALEHSVPERMFRVPENPVNGISTVKALQLANQQSIPIYSVTKDNITVVLPNLSLDAKIKGDIQNAVNAGMVVTVSEKSIKFNDWTGCGYIIMDPSTGSAGYMISGGYAGAAVKSPEITLGSAPSPLTFLVMNLLGIISLVIKNPIIIGIAAVILSLAISYLVTAMNVVEILNDPDIPEDEKGVLVAVAIFPALVGTILMATAYLTGTTGTLAYATLSVGTMIACLMLDFSMSAFTEFIIKKMPPDNF